MRFADRAVDRGRSQGFVSVTNGSEAHLFWNINFQRRRGVTVLFEITRRFFRASPQVD
jgi:hypothetical protein